MGKIEMTLRYVRSTPSGFYWEPSRKLRAAGFHPEKLGKDPVAAAARARELNAAVDREKEQPAGLQGWPPGSMGEVIELWRKSDAWAKLAPKTQHGYDYCLRPIEKWCGQARPEAVSRKAIKAWQRALNKTHGKTMVTAILRVLRLVLNVALDEDLIKVNPALKLRLASPGGNEEPWPRDDIAVFCVKALEMERPSLRLAALLMAGLGQRQGDVLRLSRSRYDAASGMFDITQNKRGRRVLIPVVPELQEAIEAAPVASPTLVISETTGRPYKSTDFRYQFRVVADAAGLPRSRKSMTLRHTMGTMLGEAGCTESEISSILGNLPEIIRKHYVRPNSAMARSAIAKLEANRSKRLTDA